MPKEVKAKYGKRNKAHEMAHRETERMVRGLDQLAEYEDLTTGLLGTLKRDLRAGLTSDQIMKKYAALGAARVVSVAATESDSGKALAASKEILDRAMGRSVERKQVHHYMEQAKDEELDALLLSKLRDVSQIETKPKDDKQGADE